MIPTPRLPSDLDCPAFLMSPPFTVDTAVTNNPWMGHARYDRDRVFEQWSGLYRRLARESVVWLLPPAGNYQDRPFVADTACVLPHREATVAISRIETLGRIDEEIAAGRFFRDLGYRVFRSPHRWEGFADLKHLRENVYIGGYGLRSSIEAFEWIEADFSATVVKVRLNHAPAYHLDASLFVLGPDKVLCAVSMFDAADVQAIGKIADIIDVPEEYFYNGWTNVLRVGKVILHHPQSPWSADALGKVLGRQGFDLELFPLSEFDKSGADLSCLVLPLF